MLILGALLCWAGWHREGSRLTLAGIQAYCRRCGCPLWPVG